jgi:uncharacterized protein YkwD
MSRCFVVVATFAVLLAGCAQQPVPQQATPSFYQRLDAANAVFDPAGLAGLINAYRAKNGLAALALDPSLNDEAMRLARQDAAADRSVHGTMPVLSRATLQDRVTRPSAGYRTAAEAFSGWRDSAGLNAAMLDPQARRLGLGAVAKPQSKYGVYWMLIVSP